MAPPGRHARRPGPTGNCSRPARPGHVHASPMNCRGPEPFADSMVFGADRIGGHPRPSVTSAVAIPPLTRLASPPTRRPVGEAYAASRRTGHRDLPRLPEPRQSFASRLGRISASAGSWTALPPRLRPARAQVVEDVEIGAQPDGQRVRPDASRTGSANTAPREAAVVEQHRPRRARARMQVIPGVSTAVPCQSAIRRGFLGRLVEG